MSEYHKIFLEALSKGSVERRTVFQTGNEALFQDGKRIAATDSNADYSAPDLIETVKAEPHLILFGSGHIGKALYDLGALQKMRMTVLDDNKKLLTEERFPKALRIAAPFSELLDKEYDAVCPAYVIFTHGHEHDTECLRYALNHDSSYIGMIGSKAKSMRTLDKLRDEGFPDEKLKGVHSPIGLPIGAESPEEIAISIMAEIISCFRSQKGFSTADPDLLKVMAENKGIEVRIIRKSGSAPRSVGSEMFVTEERIHGTIGGGAIEREAIKEARAMIAAGSGYRIKEYDLTASGDIGMVCGGRETLLFRKI